ncbi:Aste57867_2977 [Aphanomyces stellatus]|uniref:Aste57867_2977 protein n=1 Tax=Aphanomyces stellatus TaxID=120398 RepID=A0A485KDZ7_9STRA|nr:hypothetical protein As57867_002968 [Aphanomyces stellatus]VFT80159.1 Aste57867_2977 [Aphanomyces stellatus]
MSSSNPAMQTPVDPHSTPVHPAAYDGQQPKLHDAASVPMAASTDLHGLAVGSWKADIFGCFADIAPNCLMSFFCPCISLAQTLHRVGMYTYTNVLLVWGGLYLLSWILYFFQSATGWFAVSLGVVSFGFNFWSLLALCLQIAVVVILFLIRTRFRKAFQIPGHELEDCCCSFWCQCCVLAQMATHANAYTPNECNFGPKDTLPGYTFQ